MDTISYYKMLRISPGASEKEIRAAIERLRKRDTSGEYAATLNNIEKTLLADIEAQQPANKQGIDDMFFDGGHSDFLTAEEKLKDLQPAFNPAELYGSLHNGKKVRKPLVKAPTKGLGMGGVLIIAALIAFSVIGGYAYPIVKRYYLGTNQSKTAASALVSAKDKVMEEIKRTKVFPIDLTFPTSEFYQITITPQETILLTFTSNAIPDLAGRKMEMYNFFKQNVGLIWQCRVSSGFPEDLRPVQCF